MASLIGNGAGYLVAPILAYLVTAVGWRPTLLISAAVIAIVGLPLTQLLKDRPDDRGLLPDGDEPIPGAQARSHTGASVREALHSPAFYLLVMATAANATQGAWIVHQIPHLENVGFSTQTAALISGVYGLVQISLRFGIGWLGDLIGRRQMYAASFVLQGVGLIVFAHLSASRIWMLPIYFAVFATGHAAWVVFQQTMVADYFGVRRFATLRGFAGALQTPVGVIAPFLAGWMFDRHGNYELIFTIYGLIATTGAIWVMLIRRPLWVDPEPDGSLPCTGERKPAPVR